MELIKEALSKARTSGTAGLRDRQLPTPVAASLPTLSDETWSLPRVVLDAKHLESERIVSFAMTDPSHVAFNLLRTKIQKVMKDYHGLVDSGRREIYMIEN